MSNVIYHCADCDWHGTIDEMDGIIDIGERVAPGELHPAGQCPKCRALIGVDDRDVDDNTIRVCTQIGQRRLLADGIARTRVNTPEDAEAQRAMFGLTRAELDALFTQSVVAEVTPAFLVISMLSDAQELLALSNGDESPTCLPRVNRLLNAAKYYLATYVLPKEKREVA